MARRTRGSGQLRFLVLDSLQTLGEATAQEVKAALGPRSRLAATTVATVLQRLERAGEITHRVDGRRHVYRPLVTREQVRGKGLRGVLHQMFRGDVVSLVAQLLESGDVSSDDLARVKRCIARHERGRARP